MSDASQAIEDQVTDALSSFGPVYVDLRPSDASAPYSWLYSGNTVAARNGYEDTVYLHHFARSTWEVRAMEEAVAFLDGLTVGTHEHLLGVRFSLESQTRIPEVRAWHSVTLYTARYFVTNAPEEVPMER